MLPLLSHQQTLQPVYIAYLDALSQSAFEGDIDTRYSARMVQATDNSVYQFLPQAVVYPAHQQDVELLLALANTDKFKQVTFSARGGGTGTNGQSLTHGLIIDMSRHMTNVLEVNVEQGWVKVEAGVVKDALNDVLRPHGYFFSPDLSTSNRATIGGMINTDASGAGSLVYGKTSDHVLGLTSVLIDGSVLASAPMIDSKISQLDNSLASQLIQNVAQVCQQKRQTILSQFPKLNRFLTGYDLKHVWNDQLNQFDISRILTGSEGTLAVITQAKLNITPLPQSRVMVNIKYDSFESALRHAPSLVVANATVVETIDSKVLNLAREDIIWHSVSEFITDVPNKVIEGLNMVEFAGDEQTVNQKVAMLQQQLTEQLTAQQFGLVGFQSTADTNSITQIYAMRKKAVGLLGAVKGTRKPLAFAEDTAVPPENLADFIMDFRALLDRHHLQYGMFGHVDAGVLHVRPALDMCDPQDEALLKSLSDQVAKLTLKYGGLMWGEHGKGVRGEYGVDVFGAQLYGVLQQIKGWFDPDNRLNPGKLVTPPDFGELQFNVDSIKRGTFDRQIPVNVKAAFPDVMDCNGNGLCFNYSPNSPMCPSFKVTGDRIQSPKGRAGLMREWLRLLESEGVDVSQLVQSKPLGIMQRLQNTINSKRDYDYSHEVMASLKGCLACKACSSQCPVKVDVPKFRAQFFNIYYKRYMRPAKDYLVGGIEDGLPLMASMPKLMNFASQNRLSQWVIKKTIGYVDSPKLSVPTLKQRLDGHASRGYDLEALQALSTTERSQHVLVVQDPFNSFYDAGLVYRFIQLIEKLGYNPVLLPYKPNGKPAHIKGFLDKFANMAKDSADFFNQLHQLNMPLVGLDPALVLCYRDEYKEVLAEQRGDFNVLLSNEWLTQVLSQDKSPVSRACGLSNLKKPPQYTWFSHCTESTAKPTTAKEWQTIFNYFGAEFKSINIGCCGMAGTYGHEVDNLARSKALYDMSWKNQIKQYADKGHLLVSGYSCRSQVNRFDGFKPKHPIEALLTLIDSSN
ncbi:FAD-binding and (Fe-S)-binding domain-containing protein [Shewanella intestini]|uniref:FAD-binding oxidoreductase n=1 Tax=Shewanella intestini TaxID=2017544 RepID=A0ABS5I1A9_9GAMM|nr:MULTISPECIES: FAD-binding and (Fe-S)-binding domain-containing protein [Shewanella]MBR9727813.1 FAD-binding oxidoreductase [Shewanella intestini]MRG36194.1 FAD-binding protein [Shewanella sp. XMDDZSB0408]